MEIFRKRQEKLCERLAEEGLDAFLVLSLESSDYANLFYLTGFSGSFGVFLVDREPLFLTDPRYSERVRTELPHLALVEVRGKWLAGLAAELGARGHRKVAFNSRTTTVKLLEELREHVSGVEFVPVDGWVEEMRAAKDEWEIEKIRAAMRLTEEGLSWALERLTPGVTEREMALDLEMWYRKNGAEDVAFELIVAFGEHSAMPHYRPNPGTRELRKGDVALFDVGVRIAGYCSDLTRTFFYGEPTAEFRRVYELVREANERAIQGTRAGVSGVDADRLAREAIDKGGYREEFGHGLGHGVGIQVHEAPRLSYTSEDTLQTGMVVTIEPGIYLPGKFGIRIEDLAVVRPGGLEVLSSFPKDSPHLSP
jgi:Xaa-Pro aminopeptidase